MLDKLYQQIDTPNSGVWFEGTVPTSFDESTLTLRVPNSFAVEYIETRFGELMRSVVQEQVGPGTEISIQSYSTDSSGFASAQQRAM
jgi:chromosomal replication initiator protein